MRTRSTFILSLLASVLWLTACVDADIEGGEGGGNNTPHDLLQVEIPTGVIPLQITESIDTKADSSARTVQALPPPLSIANGQHCPLAIDSAVLSQPSQPSDTITRADDAVIYRRAIVLQYDVINGKLLNSDQTDIDNYTIGESISASLMESKNCNIYVLVVNEQTTSGKAAAFASETALQTAVYDLYGQFKTPTDKDIPLFGILSNTAINRMPVGDGSTEKGLILNTDGRPVKAELRRIAAKLVVKFTYEAAGYQTGEKGKIVNIPPSFTLVAGSDNFPAETKNFISKEFTISDRDGDSNSSPATGFELYVPDNRRGDVSQITRPTEKTTETAPTGSLHLLFTASEKKNSKHNLTYRFYFGGNNTTNFDVCRNSVYTLNSVISQTADSDPRVTEAGLMPEVWVDPLVTNVSDTGATQSCKVTRNNATINSVAIGFMKSGDSEMTYQSFSVKDEPIATYSHVNGQYKPNSVYYYTAYIKATVEGTSITVYGDTLSFSTNTAGMPVLKTEVQPQSVPNGLSATAGGIIVTGDGLTEAGIVYSTKDGFDYLREGSRVKNTSVKTGVAFSLTLPNLTYGTTYYYRYYAINAQGITYSTATSSFRTKGLPSKPLFKPLIYSSKMDNVLFPYDFPAKQNVVDDVPIGYFKLWNKKPTSVTDNTNLIREYTIGPVDNKQSTVMSDVDYATTYWYAFYSTNAVGTVYSDMGSFTSSPALTNLTPKTVAVGPQVSTFNMTTTGRMTSAEVYGTGPTVNSDMSETKTVTMVANTGANSRTSTIVFITPREIPNRSDTATVTQYGVVFPATFSNISGVSRNEESRDITVLSNIPWAATSNQSWCTVASGKQTGANTEKGSKLTFKITIEKNTGVERTATITVQGVAPFTSYKKTFTVTQESAFQYNPQPQDPDQVNTDFSIIEF